MDEEERSKAIHEEPKEEIIDNDENGIPSDEEEGEDVFDSSEDDENLDDDEEEARNIKEGFIVDEDEVEEEDDDVTKRKRKHKRRNRDEEDDRLSEDDLDLLMENAGVKRAVESTSGNRLKRLKRVGEDEAVEEDDEMKKSTRPQDSGTSQLDSIFADIDEGPRRDHEEDELDEDLDEDRRKTRKTGMLDELDDFIEEDEFSDEDEETRQERRAERRLQQQQQQQRLKSSAEITGLSSEKIDEMYDIFGDGHDYDWALEIEHEELDEANLAAEGQDEFDEEGGMTKPTKKVPALHDIYDLEDLKQNLLTEEDMIIRKTDIPERFQEIRTDINNYGGLSTEDQKLEKNWISDKVAVDKNFDPSYDLTEFKEAIGNAIRFMTEDNLEVPFIYAYRRNYISSRVSGGFVLTEDDLWDILRLDIEFNSIISKRDYVKKFYEELDVQDSDVDDYFQNQSNASVTELNALQDIHSYLEFKYAQKINTSVQNNSANGFNSAKKHLKNTSYEKFKNSPLYQAVKEIGITADDVGENVSSQHQIHNAVDHATSKPFEIIESVVKENLTELQVFSNNLGLAMETVKKYYSLELSKNIKVREKVRSDFYRYYLVDTVLTKKGKNEIQKGSPYEDIKYAINRTPMHFRRDPDIFLRMLEAENLNLLNIKIHMSSQDQYIDHLFQIALETTNTSELATEWNEFRKTAFIEAMEHIFSDISREIKDDLTKTCQKLVAKVVRHKFMTKLDQAPFIPNLKDPKIPKVLTLTCGQGRFGSDAIIAVFLNRKGDLVKDFKIVENPFDKNNAQAFEDKLDEIIQTCQANAIGINGPNPKTETFYKKVLEVIHKKQIVDNRGHSIPVIYVEDEVALRYQNSKRAADEFPNKPTLVKYCIALARYMHSPLLEYANLSIEELTSLAIHSFQSLLPYDMLKNALESAFVDIVNLVGVEINKATDNDYYASALKYISGFGRRKAIDFIQSLHRLNEPLLARQQLITHNILHKTIFMNSAGFLYISWYDKRQRYEDVEHDQLDSTRIHPEDYHLATKVAADALEYDPDTIAEKEDQGSMSEFIDLLKKDPDCRTKLESLNLDQYAEQLESTTGQRKLNNLSTIVLELLDGFEELRNDFHPLQGEEIFHSLSGETEKTFFKGCIIPVRVERFWHNDIKCITNSEVDCIVNAQRHAGAQYKRPANEIYEIGKTYPAKVIYIDYANISAEVSLLEHDIKHEYVPINYSKDPAIWDIQQEMKDLEEEKKITTERARAKRTHRVINHPYYFPFNSRQAEDYLRSKDRGDFVIRQSSRGDDHLTVTWKLDKDLFEHIDIKELEKENPLALGKVLVVDGQRYHDLDQLIVEFLQQKIRLLNEMTSNEKFKKGTPKEVTKFIEDYSKVNPKKSVYYFSLNYDHPGWFFINFKINANSKLYTWNVKLTNTGFYLVNYNYPSVVQLCNGFKTLLKSNRGRNPSSRPSIEDF